MAVAGPATTGLRVPVTLHQHEQQARGQSVGAPNVNSLPLHKSNCSTAVYERIQQCCVRGGENSDNYKNCLKSHEAK
jgi:hypothetical protein